MQKVNQILINIQSTIQYIVDAVIGLSFQPLYAIVAIIQALIEIWSATPDEEQEPQQTVTTYPSTNEGRRAEECEYPIGRRRIGFHTNQEEVDELNKVREQLNK